MTVFNHGAFVAELRSQLGSIPADLYRAVTAAVEVGLGKRLPIPATARPGEPAWVTRARSDIGLKEIPGKAHAPRILKMLTMLKYPFSDDETPWCGTAMAAWMTEAAIEPAVPGYRAASWATWGVACGAQLGAVGVKKRTGGNHVFLIVGETKDRRFYKALGANQSNAVNIMDVAKADVDAIRWPDRVPEAGIALPILAAGIISKNEA